MLLRALLITVAVGAAILTPWALWDPPARALTPPAAPELPDRVEVGTVGNQLPFGCPGKSFCNCDSTFRLAVLVQEDALWLGSNYDQRASPPLRVPRDDRASEWAALRAGLLDLAERHHRRLEIAMDDGASYADLLVAMATARESGFARFTIAQAALPVSPNHGWEGGM